MNTKADIAVEEFDQACQEYMTSLYEGVSGFISYEPGEKESGEKDKVFLTYGEMLYPSVNILIDNMQISSEDVMYDLGSGIGKIALQFFLKTPVEKACGVEASKLRHEAAERVYAQVKQEFSELFEGGRQLETLNRNFLEVDFSDATIFYACSTCYSEDLLKLIGEIADRCPKLRYIATNKKIPNKLPLVAIVDVECSWDKTKWHIYEKGGIPLVEAPEEPVVESKE